MRGGRVQGENKPFLSTDEPQALGWAWDAKIDAQDMEWTIDAFSKV